MSRDYQKPFDVQLKPVSLSYSIAYVVDATGAVVCAVEHPMNAEWIADALNECKTIGDYPVEDK